MKPYAFGVDIGGTTVKLGLFSTDGRLEEKWEIPTRTEESGQHILPDVAQSILAHLEQRSISPDQVEGIGIGVPGPVDSENTVHKCINLGWGVLNLTEIMNQLLPEIPNIAGGNDANVAALGELWQGGGKGFSSAVLFTLGTGVGGGVVLDGKIVSGKNGGAGEVGHMTVNPRETVPCNCGKYGCLEQYASANGIVRMAKQMMADCDTPSPLRNLPSFTAKELCDLARENDELALRILDRFGEALGRAMSLVSCTIDPDVFVVGGGMSQAGELILEPVKRYYRRYAFHVSTETPIVIAQLGNDAGIFGSVKMVLD